MAECPECLHQHLAVHMCGALVDSGHGFCECKRGHFQATAPAPAWVSAYDVTSDFAGPVYPCGIDSKKVANFLRELADRVESGRCIVGAFTVLSRAHPNDFPDTFVRMRLTEGRKQE